jgi:hypothetical protein
MSPLILKSGWENKECYHDGQAPHFLCRAAR